MDRDAISAATHGDRPFANPLDPAAIDAAIGALDLPAGARVLDVGCGAGTLLAWVAARHDVETVGIEPSPAWAAAARERGVDVVHEAALDEVALREASFDLVCCLASSHAIGAWDDALAALARWTRPGGSGLVGEGFWRRPPTDGYLEALGGATRDELPTQDALLAAAGGAGWVVEAVSEAADADWARYEEALIANGERRLAQESDPGLRAWVEAARARREHPDGRETMGFALLTLRRAG